MKIYLDHSATTPVDKEVLKAMQPYFKDAFGNPSSLHSFGQAAMRAVDEAREKVAEFLNCDFEEVIFTSGATEANNLAIMGVVRGLGDFRDIGDFRKKPHIITTSIEHPAVLEVCKKLEKDGSAEINYISPQPDGIVRLEDIEKEIKENTVLISVIYANNEIGTIQPVREIGRLIKRNREIKKQRNKEISSGVGDIYPLFHTDAVQAVNYLDLDVKNLGVDLLSLSGHKIYGPKGIGALYVKKGTPIKPIQFGGHHEFGLRPGTLNTPLIVGLGKAVELISTRDNNKLKNLRDYLWQQIQENIKAVKLNADLENRLPNNLNISINGVEGEALLLALDLVGIAVSTGSACSSGSLEPSHVLIAIGLSHQEAHGSLRITLGKDNTREEMDYFLNKLVKIVNRFRNMAPKL